MSTVFREKRRLFLIFRKKFFRFDRIIAIMPKKCYTEGMKPLGELKKLHQKRVCVALSGGRDSIALLHSLLQEGGECVVSALTCEHGIRGESSLADLKFVQNLCAEWRVPLTVYPLDVPAYAAAHKLGLEEAGRILRYEAFERHIQEGKADVIATAHHRDDYAETVLFRLLRGTSIAGLDAFPAREGIVRPFLTVSRAEIDEYIREQGLPYREDESNADTAYTRNFLRREIMPLLEERMNGCSENLVRFAVRAAEDDGYLNKLAREAITKDGGVPVNLPTPLFTRACLIVLKCMGVQKDYTSAQLKEVEKLRVLQGGRKVNLSDKIEAIREGDKVIFYRPNQEEATSVAFALGELSFGSFTLTIGEGCADDCLLFDLDKIPFGCEIRTRREGDVFTKFGGGTKSLKRFLTDKKISARVGKTLPILAVKEVVYAVCGVEISDRIKISENTKRIGYLRTCPLPSGVKNENK